MPKKKPYYHNNWQTIKDTPDEYFSMPHGDLTFDEFMDWKIGGYEIPSSVNCIIREKRVDTGEVTEYVYQTAGRARNKARQIMDEGVSELTVCTDVAVHHLYPQEVPEYDDPLA